MDSLKRLLGFAFFVALAAPALAQGTAAAPYGGPAYSTPSLGQLEQQRTVERLVEQQKTLLANPSGTEIRSLDQSRLPPPSPAEARGQMAEAIPESALPPLPEAAPGECFALVRVPAEYRERQQVYQRAPAKEWLETTPARYAQGRETYVRREAYEQTELTPAADEGGYETIREQVLERPARQVWRRGSGPVRRIDQATGDLYCLVEEPAVYRTVTRQVVKAPTGLKRVVVPEQLGQRPAARLVAPATAERVREPARLESRFERELVRPERLEWRPVLCPTNMTPEVIARVQQSLRAEGYDPGPVDGVLGVRTQRALAQYQRDQRGSLESLSRQ